eukprot:1591781-Alexandrium_andersonii.AAC.1
MGMVVQARKCCASSNTSGGRQFLRHARAIQKAGAFKVAQAMRDLGAPLNCAKGWGIGSQAE